MNTFIREHNLRAAALCGAEAGLMMGPNHEGNMGGTKL